MKRRSLDPHWLTARFAGKCSGCKADIPKGQRAFFFPNGRRLLCEKDACGGQASRDFEAAKADESGCCGY